MAPAFAQIPPVPCISPSAPPQANAANPGPGRGAVARRTPSPQSAADVAEIAKLMARMGTEPRRWRLFERACYPTAPELAKRVGVSEGKVLELVMNSAESKFHPGVNGALQRHVCVYTAAGYVAGAELPVIVSADAYGMRYNL